MSADIKQLAAQWLAAKEAEAKATDARREVEDQMSTLLALREDFDGTRSEEAGELKIKITGRMNRKIDGDKLQEIAAEHGIALDGLFRWKPEINMAAWKHAADAVTRPLLGAITTTPGRPSYAITIKE
jgi:hypothetical protein